MMPLRWVRQSLDNASWRMSTEEKYELKETRHSTQVDSSGPQTPLLTSPKTKRWYWPSIKRPSYRLGYHGVGTSGQGPLGTVKRKWYQWRSKRPCYRAANYSMPVDPHAPPSKAKQRPKLPERLDRQSMTTMQDMVIPPPPRRRGFFSRRY
jgi:hypothetical protein